VPKGLRFIPFSTVSEYGLMAVFRADEVIIENTAAHSRKRADVLIGLGDSRGEAVFNPKLLKI
jgi:stage II sporulation protein GA (sporulation sigma-E factor processing peptidase)